MGHPGGLGWEGECGGASEPMVRCCSDGGRGEEDGAVRGRWG